MKAVFAVVSLLIVLAIVGLVAVKQLRAVGKAVPLATTGSGALAVPQAAGSGPVAPPLREVQNRVADDVAKAMAQGAAARREEADKP